jgi:hypothetical protein
MTANEYEQLPADEKEHFATCSECGEIFDRRSLDEVLFHHTDQAAAGHPVFWLGKAVSGQDLLNDLQRLTTNRPFPLMRHDRACSSVDC